MLLLVAGLAAGCGSTLDSRPTSSLPDAAAEAPAPAAEDAAPVVRRAGEIQALLDEVAAAFRAGDPDRLVPLLADPRSSFGRRWQDRARYMASLPLATYDLRLDDSLPDLSTQPVRDANPGDVQVVYVVEELAFDGFDPTPAAEDLFLTVRDTGDGWQVVGDEDAEPLGFVSVDHLWDHGPVTVTRAGPLMAVHHPDGPDVTTLLEDAARALAEADQRWPLDWPGRVPIVVPRDQDELAELLHVTFDLSNFVAFATATSVGERGEVALTGSRVVVNPARFLDRSPQTRQRILVHELVHVATRPVAGPRLPSWLEEGVAQAIGEQQSTTGTALLDGTPSTSLQLPTDGQFTIGGQARIHLSYQVAWGFVDHLVDTYGVQAVGDFYAAAGRGSIGRPGTVDHHVDRAARQVFGAPLTTLVDQWRAQR